MKIWITYTSANCLWGHGLECCRVWFRKPNYYYKVYNHGDDFCFEFADEKKGLKEEGWRASTCDGLEGGSISFGRVFGYGDNKDEELSKMSLFVWSKIRQHFLFDEKKYTDSSDMFQQWVKLESDGIVKRQDFLLELDLEIKMK